MCLTSLCIHRFVWNHKLLEGLGGIEGAWDSCTLLPVITGFVAIEPVCVGVTQACLALIARRDWRRSHSCLRVFLCISVCVRFGGHRYLHTAPGIDVWLHTRWGSGLGFRV